MSRLGVWRDGDLHVGASFFICIWAFLNVCIKVGLALSSSYSFIPSSFSDSNSNQVLFRVSSMAGSKQTLYLSALTACLTSALFGYSVGFIGGLLVLPSFLSHFHLSDLPPTLLAAAQSRIVTIWLVGALMGVPLGIPVCSRWGRRSCLGMSAVLYVVGAVLQLVGGGINLFEVGRLVNGVGVGVGTLVSPMYISEISPPAERGMLMSGYQTVLQISGLIGFWGAYASHAIWPETSTLQWQVPVAIQLVPGVLLLLGILLVPETPRYLAQQGQFDEAAVSLARLRGLAEEDDALKIELGDIHEAAALSKSLQAGRESFVKEAIKKNVRKRLFVGIGLMIAQNMVGLNALNYCAPLIVYFQSFMLITFLYRRPRNIHVRRLHLSVQLSLPHRRIRCRQATLRSDIHVLPRTYQGQHILAQARLNHLRHIHGHPLLLRSPNAASRPACRSRSHIRWRHFRTHGLCFRFFICCFPRPDLLECM